ncbi:MAG: potassium transporter TrkG, partial [Oscillospiraceae bacterium]|nr:potassium transporter TrkG [Oscillospiraceae bacterium]
MNRRMIARTLGITLLAEAAFLLLPALVSLIYSEDTTWALLVSAGVSALLGLLLASIKPRSRTIFAREGFLIVSLGWIGMSIIGALPFYLSGEIPNLVDAFFETVSGFTTTGASILSDVEALSKSLLFWRSFTHWIGGMGVLVFVMAVLPLAGGGGDIHLMRAESPGPEVEKLVPKSTRTAKLLYGMYLFLTLFEVILLLCGGVDLFESLTVSFGTAGTGGFAIKNSSLAEYTPYVQWVVAVFMMLFGINFG